VYRLAGHASSPFGALIGELTLERLPFYRRKDMILYTDTPDRGCMGYLAVITAAEPEDRFHLPHMLGNVSPEAASKLKQGDILSVSGTGEAAVLWDQGSRQNSLLLTEACNCRCLMCPQPPRRHDPALPAAALRVLDLLKGKRVESICITGGEPALPKEDFIGILRRCAGEHPNAEVNVLTNAKPFSDASFAGEAALAAPKKAVFCASLHSDLPQVHDAVVGKPGSYDLTNEGVYNLAVRRVPLEIRHVIVRRNHDRLLEFARHLYRYFPFCAHYAFMSMETCGLAAENLDEIYVEPNDYRDGLRAAVLAMSKRGLPVSVYNTPLCLCHEDIRPFARRSISAWKNVYLEQCGRCAAKASCCGFFSTSVKLSGQIEPLAAA
jgi:His-Xaa-Ser system radical SAM maturase HxsC